MSPENFAWSLSTMHGKRKKSSVCPPPPKAWGNKSGLRHAGVALPMRADGDLVFDGMDKFLMPRIWTIQGSELTRR